MSRNREPLSARPLAELLEDVAARTPAPGGGCSAAWSCALAASLVEMTASFTLQRPDYADRHERMVEIRARARSLRDLAIDLGERELHSYEPVLDALRLPQDDPERPRRLDAASSQAADTPYELARAAAEVAALALEASRSGAPHLSGDAITGVLLAEGACQAAAALVRINLADRPLDPRLIELGTLTQRAAAARAETGLTAC